MRDKLAHHSLDGPEGDHRSRFLSTRLHLVLEADSPERQTPTLLPLLLSPALRSISCEGRRAPPRRVLSVTCLGAFLWRKGIPQAPQIPAGQVVRYGRSRLGELS